jgi:hypothetical protein
MIRIGVEGYNIPRTQCWRKIDTEKFREHLQEHVPLIRRITLKDDIEQEVQKIHKALEMAVDHSTA